MTSRIYIHGNIDDFKSWTIHDLMAMSQHFHKIKFDTSYMVLEYDDDISCDELMNQSFMIEDYLVKELYSTVHNVDLRLWNEGVNSITMYVSHSHRWSLMLKSCLKYTIYNCKKMLKR